MGVRVKWVPWQQVAGFLVLETAWKTGRTKHPQNYICAQAQGFCRFAKSSAHMEKSCKLLNARHSAGSR